MPSAQDLLTKSPVSLADEEIDRMLTDGTLTKRLSKTGGTAWGDKNKLAVHRSGLPVDFFRTTPEVWFNALVRRTGPAETNPASPPLPRSVDAIEMPTAPALPTSRAAP